MKAAIRLKILLPTHMLIDEEAQKIVAEAENGSFGLLPRHVDFVTSLVPGIFLFIDKSGVERVFGLDEGILVKCGGDVSVVAANAITGTDLEDLKSAVRAKFLQLDEQQKSARSALARLEAGVIRRFIDREKMAS